MPRPPNRSKPDLVEILSTYQNDTTQEILDEIAESMQAALRQKLDELYARFGRVAKRGPGRPPSTPAPHAQAPAGAPHEAPRRRGRPPKNAAPPPRSYEHRGPGHVEVPAD